MQDLIINLEKLLNLTKKSEINLNSFTEKAPQIYIFANIITIIGAICSISGRSIARKFILIGLTVQTTMFANICLVDSAETRELFFKQLSLLSGTLFFN